ncbi:hypothetical protein BDZ89DRAFT_1042596 [Hymenopellis radicata]|nr:hypothetical protein BDZ89DRAFT_1042596 [Hymenopellis radicata]
MARKKAPYGTTTHTPCLASPPTIRRLAVVRSAFAVRHGALTVLHQELSLLGAGYHFERAVGRTWDGRVSIVAALIGPMGLSRLAVQIKLGWKTGSVPPSGLDVMLLLSSITASSTHQTKKTVRRSEMGNLAGRHYQNIEANPVHFKPAVSILYHRGGTSKKHVSFLVFLRGNMDR